MVRKCRSTLHLLFATCIKGILNHHMVVYIHSADCHDGKRLPLSHQTTFKIMLEGFLKTILIYAIILIVLHMDKITILTYLSFFIFDIFDNHYQSVKNYLAKEVARSELNMTHVKRRVSISPLKGLE